MTLKPDSVCLVPSAAEWLLAHDDQIETTSQWIAARYRFQRADAADFAQQLRVHILRRFGGHPGQLQEIESPAAFLNVCAKRLACSEFRKQARRSQPIAIREADEFPEPTSEGCAALDETLRAMRACLNQKDRDRLLTRAVHRTEVEEPKVLQAAAEEARAKLLPPPTPAEKPAWDRACHRAQTKLEQNLPEDVRRMLARMGIIAGLILLAVAAWSLFAPADITRSFPEAIRSVFAEKEIAGHRSHDPSNDPPLAALSAKPFPWQLGHRS
jgi:DNA-directed RNA polymerase specialized sigma24 family protein